MITNRENIKGGHFLEMKLAKHLLVAKSWQLMDVYLNGWFYIFISKYIIRRIKSSQCLSQGHTVFWSNPFTLARAISILCSSKFVRGDNAFVCSWCFALRKRLPWKIHFHPNKMYIMHILQASIVMTFFHIDEKSNVKWKF